MGLVAGFSFLVRMASKQTTSLLAEVEVLKPSSRLECFILFFHCLVQDESFLNTHVHDMAVTTTARSLPDVWNSSSSCFSFQYERGEIQYYMRARPIDHEVILHFDKKASKSSSRHWQVSRTNEIPLTLSVHSLEECL
jgi:hypothetical protein